MSAKDHRGDSRQSATIMAYYLVLVVLLGASFFPQYRIWGVNWWAYYPLAVRLALFVIGALVPLIVSSVRDRRLSGSGNEVQAGGDARYFTVLFILIATYAPAFYLLRARTHFLGDGYTVLSLLAENNPLVKTREAGEALLHIWVKDLFGRGEASALLSFQTISIAAGVLFLVAGGVISRRLYRRTTDRVLFMTGLASGGYMLLFFGYVENYSLFVMAVGVYSLVGLLAIRQLVSRWAPVPLLGLAIFLHVLGVTLVPSAVYILMVNSPVAAKAARLKPGSKLLGLILVAAAVIIAFSHFYSTSFYFRFAFVPILENRFTVEGYTLFALKHLLDFINLLILLTPALPMFIAFLVGRARRQLIRHAEFRYWFVLVGTTLAAVFVFDPKIGMPRDWDLFAFAGVPLTLVGYRCLLSGPVVKRSQIGPAVLATTLALLLLVPRVVSQVKADYALKHFRTYLALDRIKNRTARHILDDYLEKSGRLDEVAKAKEQFTQDFPEVPLLNTALAFARKEAHGQAIQLLRQVTDMNPLDWNAWSVLGVCYRKVGRLDQAMECQEIAEGINPHHPTILSNKAYVHYYRKEYGPAERLWLRVLSRDSAYTDALAGLARLYRIVGDRERQSRYLRRALSQADAPLDLMEYAGEIYLRNGQYEQAAAIYKQALQRGLDSSTVRQLLKQHPELEPFLPLLKEPVDTSGEAAVGPPGE